MPKLKKAKVTDESASQISDSSQPPESINSEDLLNESGSSGTNLYQGFLNEDYNQELTGMEGMKMYDKMRRGDAQVRVSVLVMELPIRAVRWYVKPGKNEDDESSDEDQAIAKFVEKALFEKMEQTWGDFLHEVLTMLPFGFSVFEKVYKIEEDKVWIKKLGFRKQSSVYKWETSVGAPGITQLLPTPKQGPGEKNVGMSTVSIPAQKLLLFTFSREGDNYEGISVLRSAYLHWYFKQRLYKFDGIRHERMSVGIPKITLSKDATDVDKQEARKIGKNLRTTEETHIVLPFGSEAELMALPQNSGTNLLESIGHHNREIVKNVLAQFLELGNTESGSRALGQSQQELFMMCENTTAKYLQDVMNRFLIRELVDLNFDNVENYPTLVCEPIGPKEMAIITGALKNMTDAGVIRADDKLEDHVREFMDLPARSETPDAVPRTPKGAAVPGQDPANPKAGPEKKSDADPVVKDDIPAAKKDEGSQKNTDVEEFKEIMGAVDNNLIISLQNECRTEEDRAAVKKKGLVFNDFEKEAPRPLTFAERRVNFSVLKRALDSFGNVLDEKLAGVEKKIREDLLAQVKRAVENNDIKAIGNIRARYRSELSQELTNIQKEMFEIGKKTAATEMKVKVPPTKQEVRGALRVQSDAAVDKALSDLENAAKTETVNSITKAGGRITNTSAVSATAAVASTLEAKITRVIQGLKTLATTGAVNLGRSTIFERYPEQIYAMQYSAILDSVTCYYCLSLDGRVVKPGSAQFVEFNPPAHYNCRCIWVEILNDDSFKPEITGIPASIKPTTLDTFQQLKAPKFLKDSPAIQQIRDEIADREKKLEELKAAGKFPNRQKQHEDAIDVLKKSISGKYAEEIKSVLISQGINFV